MDNANWSRGHKDKKAYEGFVKKYEEFVRKWEVEGCHTSVSRVGDRSPLQLALMISPLYLFVTSRLSTKSYNRRTLIDLAAKLGPRKPPLISKVENLIWDSLFKLAEGRLNVYDVLLGLSNSLPWDEIDGDLNRVTKTWFHLDSGMLTLF